MTSTAPGPAPTAARSPASPSSSAPGAPAAGHLSPSRRLLVAVALVALIGTGCASASGGTGDGGDQAGPTGPPPAPAELQELLQLRREAARCMRENGVEDFPDPGADGYILYYGDDPDMGSTSVECDDLLRASRGRG